MADHQSLLEGGDASTGLAWADFHPGLLAIHQDLPIEKGKVMTETKKLATVGGAALLSGIAMMIVLHQFGPGHFTTDSTGMPWAHLMMHVPGEMGWAIALGPVAMALWFGGILSLVVALVRKVAKAT